MKDAQEKNMAPQKVIKYKNVCELDPETKKKKYTVSVQFVDKEDDRMHYKFSKLEGEEPKTKVYALPPEDEMDRLFESSRRFLDQF